MNRRIRRASITIDSIQRFINDRTIPNPGFTVGDALAAVARHTWHLNQHDIRTNPGLHSVLEQDSISRITDPLHTQWLSSTLTPYEYQHLVRRSQWERQVQEAREPADPDWWLRVAESIEDDFLYRHLAPCGAD